MMLEGGGRREGEEGEGEGRWALQDKDVESS